MSHWYDKEGKPCYEVACSSKDGMRPTTIRDARKLQLVPSVTTIIDILQKDGLERWKTDQIIKAVLENPPVNLDGDLEVKWWKSKILEKSKEVGQLAAKRGTAIHDQIEKAVNGQEAELLEYVNPVLEILNNTEPFTHDIISEKSFSSSMGFGGKVDLHGIDFVLDFKTKDSDNFDKQLAYDGHCMQLAAYREGLKMPTAKCYNLFISAQKPGLLKLHEWSEEEIQRGWKMFKCLLEYWKLCNNFEVT